MSTARSIPPARHLLGLALAAGIAAAPARAAAQEPQEAPPSLMEQGLDLFLEGLRREMAPSLDELREMMGAMGPALRGFVQEMGPALADILEEVEDWTAYHPPEMLPNGDIILRRKAAPDTDPAPETGPETGPENAPDTPDTPDAGPGPLPPGTTEI